MEGSLHLQLRRNVSTPAARSLPRRYQFQANIFQQSRCSKFLHQRRASASSVSSLNASSYKWKTYAWRMVWVPYALLTGIPITSSVAGLYHYAMGDAKKARGCAFFAVTGFLSLPLSVPLLLASPYIMFVDNDRRLFADFIQKMWGRTTTRSFFETKVEGLERIRHLDGKAAVYVSNHQSWLDIYALFWVDPLALKIVSKKEIMMIPLVGWVRYLIGHIPFDRKKGGHALLKKCEGMLARDIPVFFFPEGTRSRDGKLGKFKAGAFVLAERKQVPIVPITILGTRELMPPGNEFWEGGSLALDGDVRVIIHDPIYPKHGNEVLDGDQSAEQTAVQNLMDVTHEVIGRPLGDSC